MRQHLEAVDWLAALGDGSGAVDLLVLFGSLARPGGPRVRDVDIGVLYRGGVTVRERWLVEDRLRRALRAPVDIVDLAAAPPLLRFEIARDGVVLYERRPFLWADFQVRAMGDWWDWAPYQRRIDRGAVRKLAEVGSGSA